MLQTLARDLESLKKKKLSREKGFTLIELLLVIGIVAVLLITAFIVYSTLSNASKAQSLANQGRSFLSAIETFAGDNNGVYEICTLADGTCTRLSDYLDDDLLNSGWNYTCDTTNVPSTLIVESPVINNGKIAEQVANKLDKFGNGWSCSSIGNKVECIKNDVVCRQ